MQHILFFTCIFRKFFLKFADLHTSEICGFVIADCAQEFAELWLADCKKNICAPTFDNYIGNVIWLKFQMRCDNMFVICLTHNLSENTEPMYWFSYTFKFTFML
jgi:hypothetical protein